MTTPWSLRDKQTFYLVFFSYMAILLAIICFVVWLATLLIPVALSYLLLLALTTVTEVNHTCYK